MQHIIEHFYPVSRTLSGGLGNKRRDMCIESSFLQTYDEYIQTTQ
jgi:hypothetical protein